MTQEELEDIRLRVKNDLYKSLSGLEGERITPDLKERVKKIIEATLKKEGHISAGQIRNMGFDLDPAVPDYATVPISSIESESTTTADPAGEQINVSLTYKFTKPFTWEK